MKIKGIIHEESFDGELAALFDGDPFNIGHAGNGAIMGVFSEARRAVKAGAEGTGGPQPLVYEVEAEHHGSGKFTFGFKVLS